MENKKITCNHLWKKSEKNLFDQPNIIEAQKRMKSYSKDDWENMVIDAKKVVEGISLLIKENIDIKDPRSEKAFQKFLDHVSEYFFKVDKIYMRQLYFAILSDKEHRIFFDQFHEGMSIKILKLIETYPEKFKQL
jgi:hypothetical protein